jgi:hypothetical protein
MEPVPAPSQLILRSQPEDGVTLPEDHEETRLMPESGSSRFDSRSLFGSNMFQPW